MSNVPPPFVNPPMGQRPKDKTVMIILVVIAILVGGCILVAGMATWFGVKAVGQAMPFAGCGISFEAVHDSLKQYADEHEGKLPKAENWQEELRPYVAAKLEKIQKEMKDAPGFVQFKMMSPNGEWGCYLPDSDKMTGMAFNTEYSGKKVADIKSPGTAVLVFETETPKMNQAMAYKPLDDKTSPKIFGQNRGWITVTWDDVKMKMEDGNSDFKFKIDPKN